MIRDIRISAVLNGFEVKVGCQTLVFTDVTEMLKEIRRYLKKPEEVEKEYLEKALNVKHVVPGIALATQYYASPGGSTSASPQAYPPYPNYSASWTTCAATNTASSPGLGND